MDTKVLKDKILQLAFQGKLFKQDIIDESAKVLLKRIRLEKKDASVAEILNEEEPFELPNGWEWCKIGEVTQFNPKNSVDKEAKASFIPMKLISDGYNNSHTFEEKPWEEIKNGFTHFAENDVLIAKITPCFENRKSVIAKDLINGIGAGTTELYVLRSYTGLVMPEFLFYLIKTKEFIECGVKTYTGTAGQQRVRKEFVQNYVFGLPPLSEQKRIIVKVKELFALIDELEDNKQELLQNISQTRSKLIQLAMQGRLVKQNEKDEPASILLYKIQEEKQRLAKAKIVKDENPLPQISEEEKTYDLPKGWEWVRLGDIIQLNPRNKAEDNMEVSFIPMSLIGDAYSNSHTLEDKLWGEVKSGFTHFAENDLVVAKITPCFENRKSAIVRNLKNGIGAGTTELYVLRPYGGLVMPEFLFYLIKSKEFIERGVKTYTGTAGQQRVKKEFVQNYVFGLPPLEEQKLIVEKVSLIMEHLRNLEKEMEL
jgi:type I restriction enzyme, S subunit